MTGDNGMGGMQNMGTTDPMAGPPSEGTY
jgi:hypothetical protein